MINISHEFSKSQKKILTNLCKLYAREKSEVEMVMPEGEDKEAVRIYLYELVLALGKRPLYKKEKPSLKEMKNICQEIIKKTVEKVKSKDKLKKRNRMLNKFLKKKVILNYKVDQNLFGTNKSRRGSQPNLTTLSALDGYKKERPSKEQLRRGTRRAALVGTSNIDLSQIGQFQAQYRVLLQANKRAPSISSSSSQTSEETNINFGNNAHPNVTAKKILEAYKVGQMGEVSSLMSEQWQIDPRKLANSTI